MSELPQSVKGNRARLQDILAEAERRYVKEGEKLSDVMFVYHRKSDKQDVALTLTQAMEFSGEYMAEEDLDFVFEMLEYMREAAIAKSREKPAEYEKARELGKKALELKRHGVAE